MDHRRHERKRAAEEDLPRPGHGHGHGPAPAPAPALGLELPPPSPDMVCLGEARFRCESHGGATILEVDARIVRHGVACENGYTPRFEGPAVHLHNAFRRHHTYRTPDPSAPLSVLPDEHRPKPETPREMFVPLIVARWSRRGVRPRMHGITVAGTDRTVGDVVRKAAGAGLLSSEEAEAAKFHVASDPDPNTFQHLYSRNMQHGMFPGRRTMVVHVPYRPFPDAAAATDEVTLIIHHVDERTRTREHGIPVVMAVDRATAEGGKDADARVKRELRLAMGARAEGRGLWLLARHAPQSNRFSRKFESEQRFAKRSPLGPGAPHAVNLLAVWEYFEGLDSEWLAPETDPSVDRARLEASVAVHDRFKCERVAFENALRAPLYRLQELTEGSLCSRPENQQHVPFLRARLHLEAPHRRATEGVAVVRVWAWARDPAGRDRFKHQRLVGTALQLTTTVNQRHSLGRALCALAASCPEAELALSERARWHGDSPTLRTPAALLEKLEAGDIAPADQPAGLSVPLRPYQLQTLGFMQRAEAMERGFAEHFWHRVPPGPRTGASEYWLSPLFVNGHAHPDRPCGAVEWHERAGFSTAPPPPSPRGGFLCETMGLGKTVEVLALIVSDLAGAARASGGSRATLVVCPVSIAGQWAAEAEAKTGGALRVLRYTGRKRCKDEGRLANDYDLVVTTYSIVSQGWRSARAGGSPLHKVAWRRLVLDESHCVKNPSAVQTRACADLIAERRWCCTATPVSGTDLWDLSGQMMALRVPHFRSPGVFRELYKSMPPCADVLYALGRMTVRHTEPRRVLRLPDLEERVVEVAMTPAESALYLAKYRESRRAFDGIVGQGGAAAASRNHLRIMSLLLPLRRMASGGSASASAGTAARDDGRGLEPPPADEQCAVCLDFIERPARTPCGHWFCDECISRCLERSSACPLCRGEVRRDKLARALPGGAVAAAPACESKLLALIGELKAMREADPSSKALVFSQFSGSLDRLKELLPAEGFGFRHIDGGMTAASRSKAIADFQNDPGTSVFLLSVRTGAVGINLTAADHVFMLEPPLNPALEEQAIGRAWRMGQERRVAVVRLYVKGSVEENIMELNRTRAQGRGAEAAAEAEAEATGRLQTDRRALKLEEFALLFRPPSLG